MNHRKSILTLICLALCFNSFAKKRIHKIDSTDYSNTRLRYFFIEPISLIDIYNKSSLRLGTEYSISKRYAAGATVGAYGSGYYACKLEMKRYFAFRAKQRYYVSLQYFYKHTDLTVNDVSRTLPKGSPGYDINYKVNRYASFMNINTGIVTFHRHHFIFDGYMGIGIRYHSVTVEGLTPAQDEDRFFYHDSVIDKYTNGNDEGWRLNLSLGVRFGFRY